MLLIGENGIGKKSFINTLCEQNVYETNETGDNGDGQAVGVDEMGMDQKGMDSGEMGIGTKEVWVKKDYPIRLTVHMTNNYGYNLDNSTNTSTITSFLDTQFEKKLQEEAKIQRNRYVKDGIIHLVVLFVTPKTKGLMSLEVELIKAIEQKCNLIIVIGKSDLLTEEELRTEKQLVNQSIKQHHLKVYSFVDELEEEADKFKFDEESDKDMNSIDREFITYFSSMQKLLPFSVINSTHFLQPNMRTGIMGPIDIDKYSDIKYLKDIVFNLNLHEFKDLTSNIIYEGYRTERLTHSY